MLSHQGICVLPSRAPVNDQKIDIAGYCMSVPGVGAEQDYFLQG